MYKFIYIDDENEYGEIEYTVEHQVDSHHWPTLVNHFNTFLAGCGFVAHDNKVDYPFCEPKDSHIIKL